MNLSSTTCISAPKSGAASATQTRNYEPDRLAPVWPSGRFAMTMGPGTTGICSKIETGTPNTADSTSLGMAVRG
jgi:hypothetical protein